MATPRQTDPQFKLRLTTALKDQIEKSAAANNRSMNAEIVGRLDAYDAIYDHMRELVAERDLLAAQLDQARNDLLSQMQITAGLQELLRKNADEEKALQEAKIAIEKRFNELKDQADYLERIKGDVLDVKDLREKLAYQEGMSASLRANLDVFIKHLASPESDAKAVLERIIDDIKELKPPKHKASE